MNNDSFFSMDRLIEFGLGMSVAQQMVRSMNSAMQEMHVPGAMNPMQKPQGATYYCMLDNAQAGPFSEAEIMQLIGNQKITKDTFMWKPGMLAWKRAEELPEVLRLVALTPPPFNPNNTLEP